MQSYSRHVSKRTAAVCALLLVVVTVAAPSSSSSCRGSSVRRPSCGEFQAKPLTAMESIHGGRSMNRENDAMGYTTREGM